MYTPPPTPYNGRMGRIVHLDTLEARELLPFHTVGRAPGSALQAAEGRAGLSRLHAVIAWRDTQWTVRDLGSRNGTRHNGAPIAPGADVPLVTGDVLEFGLSGDRWRLASEAPPRPAAIPLSGGAALFGWEGGFALPNAENPEVFVVVHEGGDWVAIRGDEERPLNDGALVTAGGETWRVHLPGARSATVAPEQGTVDSAWGVSISVDDELGRVDAALLVEVPAEPPHRFELGTRAHLLILLTLARERERDERRQVPSDDAGWLSPEDLRAHLGLTRNAFYVQLCRLRAQVAATGILEPDQVIERRFSGVLRVGTTNIHIRRVDL